MYYNNLRNLAILAMGSRRRWPFWVEVYGLQVFDDHRPRCATSAFACACLNCFWYL